jgi:hypothetical protein
MGDDLKVEACVLDPDDGEGGIVATGTATAGGRVMVCVLARGYGNAGAAGNALKARRAHFEAMAREKLRKVGEL